MRLAVLVKQIPAFVEMEMGADGRLRREGLPLEMNPFCRRAVSQAVELAGTEPGSTVTVITLGPPAAADTLREAIAWGLDMEVDTVGLLITDPAFAGSDTLATARALAVALRRSGPFDLILAGRNSVDADTGQVGPELAELLDLPFLGGVRDLTLIGRRLWARCEHDEGWAEAETALPAVISCAERLIEPCKVDHAGREAVPAGRISCLAAADLGPGPWGQAGSPTSVGAVRVIEVHREHRVLSGPVEEQVRLAVDLLVDRGALAAPLPPGDGLAVPPGRPLSGPAVVVVVEPERAHLAREMLGAAAQLAECVEGHVIAFTAAPEAGTPEPGTPETGGPDAGGPDAGGPDAGGPDAGVLGSWGADAVVALAGTALAEDVSAALAGWATDQAPWAVLAPSTLWGREVSGRAAAALGAGLTGDAVGVSVEGGRLVAWKPAFGGQVVAAIAASSAVQMATVRPGVLPALQPRMTGPAAVTSLPGTRRGRVTLLSSARDDDSDRMAEAAVVVGVGRGVAPDDYEQLSPLLDVLGAELGATRKVTDQGWLPHSRQIGITGRSIAPHLYVAIGISGKFNHMVGVRSAGTVLAVNPAPAALVFDWADIGITAGWREAVPLLVAEIGARRQALT